MIPLMLFVQEGRHAPSREGRSWLQIGLGAWGTDILRERSYVWLLISRLFFLMAPSLLLFLGLFFLTRTLHIPIEDTGPPILIITLVMGGLTGLTTFPAAKLSDRVGRKKMIYVAIALGAVGHDARRAVAQLPVHGPGLDPGRHLGAHLPRCGLGLDDRHHSQGDKRPLHGHLQRCDAASGPLARLSSGLLLTVLVLLGLPRDLWGVAPAEESAFYEIGPRVAVLMTLIFFAIAAVALRRVDPTRRED